MGSTPSIIQLAVGEHQVLIRKSGYRVWQRKLKLIGGDIKIIADLESDAPPQKQSGSDTHASGLPSEINVYYRSWETGKGKTCETYSGEPLVLICDGSAKDSEGAFDILIAKNTRAAGISKVEGYNRALLDVVTHSRRFSVKFSEEAWPEPRTGRRSPVELRQSKHHLL